MKVGGDDRRIVQRSMKLESSNAAFAPNAQALLDILWRRPGP